MVFPKDASIKIGVPLLKQIVGKIRSSSKKSEKIILSDAGKLIKIYKLSFAPDLLNHNMVFFFHSVNSERSSPYVFPKHKVSQCPNIKDVFQGFLYNFKYFTHPKILGHAEVS